MEIWHRRMLITTFAASLAQRHSLAGNSLEGALELKLEDGFLMTAKPCNWVHLLLPFFTPYHYPENEKITILFTDIGVVWNSLAYDPNRVMRSAVSLFIDDFCFN